MTEKALREKDRKRRYYVEHRPEILARQKQSDAKRSTEKAAYRRAYYRKNRDRMLAAAREYWQATRGERLAYLRRWREQNPETVKTGHREWYQQQQADPVRREQLLEMRRRSYRRHAASRNAHKRQYYRDNPDKVREKGRKYRASNKEYIQQYRRACDFRHRDPDRMYRTERVVWDLLVEMFGEQAARFHDRSTLRNPKRGGRYLELDFLIGRKGLALEIQGPLHRLPIFGQKKLKQTQRRDALKRRLCRKQGIQLLEVEVGDGAHYERPAKRQALLRMVRAMINGALNVPAVTQCLAQAMNKSVKEVDFRFDDRSSYRLDY